MKPFRFVHAADLHLDTPFHGIGRVPPDVARVLQEASLEAWDALVRLTIEREAEFLLLGGDIYDGPERGIRAQLRFRRGLEQLAERRIETFIVHGNHDPLDGWSAISSWPTGVTVFGSKAVESVPVRRDDRTLAVVHGISYAKRETTENLALDFSRAQGEGLQIGLLHCNVGGTAEHASYSPCSLDDLRVAGLDYWALGHVHRLHVFSDSEPLVAYPGCLQGRSTHPAERGPKGALIVEADDRGVRELDFEPLDRVRILDLEVDVSPTDDVPALHRELVGRATAIRATTPTRGVVLRAILTGRGEVHRDLLRPGAVQGLLNELRREAEGDHPFFWWSAILDQSAPEFDLEAVRARGDFSAELLRLSSLLKEDDGRRAEWVYAAFEPLRRGSLQRWLASEPLDSGALVDRAERLALDVLEDAQEA